MRVVALGVVTVIPNWGSRRGNRACRISASGPHICDNWHLRRTYVSRRAEPRKQKGGRSRPFKYLNFPIKTGAGERIRTVDPNLGKASGAIVQLPTGFYQDSNYLTINAIFVIHNTNTPYHVLPSNLATALLKS